MNKSLWVVVLSSLFLSGCILNQNKSVPITGTEEQKAEKLAQIMAQGGAATCSVTSLEDGSITNMTLLGKKMKIARVEAGETKKNFMINDGNFVYSWVDGETNGFKMKLPTEEEAKAMTDEAQKLDQYRPEQTAATLDDELKFKTDCTKGAVTDADFTPPTGVNFVDPTQMQNLTPDKLRQMMPAKE